MLWKYYKNIVNVTLFLKFLPRFRQHFFFLSFSTMTLPQFHSIFFFPHFRQCHCHKLLLFFFFFEHSTLGHTGHKTGQKFGQRNFGNSIAEIPLLSLSNFFFFSLLFLLNFGNTVAEILSLSSICQLNSNSIYNAN